MAQEDFGTINPATKSGAALADDLNNFRDALHTMHKGATRPTYVQGGMLWIKEVSSTTWELYLYDGTNDILFATFNPTLDYWSLGTLGTGGIPASAIVDGTGSGLDADLLDGKESSEFREKTDDVFLDVGKVIKLSYTTVLDANDGKITAGVHGDGLNIIGIASTGNSTRYITMHGDVTATGWINGTLGVTSQGTTSGTRITSERGILEAKDTGYGYARVVFHVPGTYAWSIQAENDSNRYIRFRWGTDGNGDGGVSNFVISSNGDTWLGWAGNWASAIWARLSPPIGMGSFRWDGTVANCGNIYYENYRTLGYETFAENQQLRVRPFGDYLESYNCNCVCDGCGGGTCVVEGTLVLLHDGTEKAIEDILIGDFVVDVNGFAAEVIGVYEVPLGDRPLHIWNEVGVTPDHPVLTEDGWRVVDAEAMSVHKPVIAVGKNERLVVDYRDYQLNAPQLEGTKIVPAAPETRMFSLVLANTDNFMAGGVAHGALRVIASYKG